MTAPQVIVTMAIVATDQQEIARAMETFSRAAAGLALEGMTVQVTAATVPDDDQETTE